MNLTNTEVDFKDVNLKKFYTLMPLSSLTIRSIVYPLNLVKTRMQSDIERYKTMKNTFTHILKKEGIKSFYRGFGVSLLGMINGPIYITTLETVRETLREKYGGKSYWYDAASGCSAAIITQTVSTPLEIVSQRRMIQHKEDVPEKVPTDNSNIKTKSSNGVKKMHTINRGKNISTINGGKNVHTVINANASKHTLFSTIRNSGRKFSSSNYTVDTKLKSSKEIVRELYSKSGVLGFYRGYTMSVITFGPSSAISWGSFRYWRLNIHSYLSDSFVKPYTGLINIISSSMGGLISGFLAGGLTTPLDTIRTRQQLLEKNGKVPTIFGTINDIYKTGGIKNFWSGVLPRSISLSIVLMCVMTAYETVKRISYEKKDDKKIEKETSKI